MRDRRLREDVNEEFDISTGHDHDGVNSKSVTVGTVGDGTITDAKLATAVKVGDVATLNTTEKGNVVGAINEVDTNADAAQSTADGKYTKPGGGIPDTDMTAAVQTSLAAADAALIGAAAITCVRAGKITLNGANPSPVAFKTATAATEISSNAETYDLTGVGDGGTLIVDPDGDGDQTATINAAAGTSVSGATASQDITAEDDNKFDISVDGDSAEEVALTNAGANTGNLIAAEMQTKIRALGGNKTSVTCTFGANQYTITSTQLGTGSNVVITPASTNNITEELELGTADGGTENAGTGDCADLSAMTAAEIATVCTTDMAGLVCSDDGGSVRFTSDSTGKDSSLVFGNGTCNAVVGFTNAEKHYGGQALGYATDMDDANYYVAATLNGVGQANLAAKCLGVTNRAASGFDVECETAAATDDVDVVIFGVPA